MHINPTQLSNISFKGILKVDAKDNVPQSIDAHLFLKEGPKEDLVIFRQTLRETVEKEPGNFEVAPQYKPTARSATCILSFTDPEKVAKAKLSPASQEALTTPVKTFSITDTAESIAKWLQEAKTAFNSTVQNAKNAEPVVNEICDIIDSTPYINFSIRDDNSYRPGMKELRNSLLNCEKRHLEQMRDTLKEFIDLHQELQNRGLINDSSEFHSSKKFTVEITHNKSGYEKNYLTLNVDRPYTLQEPIPKSIIGSNFYRFDLALPIQAKLIQPIKQFLEDLDEGKAVIYKQD